MGYKKTYDLGKQPIIIGTGEDSFGVDKVEGIKADFFEDQNSVHVSANGNWRLVKNNNESGTVTVTLSASSAANIKIMLLHKSGIQFPIASADKTSVDGFFLADGCKVQKIPGWSRAKEEENIDWIFVCGSLNINHSGAADE